MSGALPYISVIAPTYDRADIVDTTVRHLLAQDYPRDRFEVLLVDNSPTVPEVLLAWETASPDVPVRLVRTPERLPAVKRNLGVRAARGDLCLFINDDVWFAPDALRRHAEAHRAQPGPVAVLGHVRQSPRMEQTPFVQAYQPFAYDELAGRAGQALPYRYFWSMNLSLPRRTMLERNLLFHEDWAEIGHEDVELGARWAQAGLPLVYEPAATGEHFHPHTVRSACRLQESVGRGMRDLEWLVSDPALHERYGIFRWSNSPRAVLRGTVRRALFNGLTVPAVVSWLEAQEQPRALATWMHWKVLLHHTNRGYRRAPARRPARLPVWSAPAGPATVP